MGYTVRNVRPAVVHVPDAGLRLDPGQRATVAALSPQMAQLLAMGALLLESPAPTPVAVLASSPAPSRAPTVTRRVPAPHRNAATVLPPALLAQVQRVVTGYVTIPVPTTATDKRHRRLVKLRRQGATLDTIAATLQLSRRQVSRMLRSLAKPGAAPSSTTHPLPARLLAQVQRHVTGRLYVPRAASATARRRQPMEEAFQAGEPTAVIARCMQCSTRQVRRERARWRAAQAGAASTPPCDAR